MKRQLHVLLITLFLASSLPCWAAMSEEREWLPLNKLMETIYLDKFYATPLAQRDKVKVRGTLVPRNKDIKASDVVLTIAHADGKQRITVAVDGSFELAPSAKAIQENPMVFTNMPKGEKAGLGLNMFANLPETTQFSYADLTAGIGQGNALIKSQAGVLSLFMPKLNGVLVRFAKPGQQTLKIATKAGVQTLASDANGLIKLKLDAALLAENPLVTASERVLEAEIDEIK